MKVQVNGYGMLPFRATECYKFRGEESLVQFRGEVKLPKGVRAGDGKKWVQHDYWYDPTQIGVTYGTSPSEADAEKFREAIAAFDASLLDSYFTAACDGKVCTKDNCSCKKAETLAKQNDVNESESFSIRQVGTLDDIDKNVYKIYFTSDGGKSYYRTSICKFVIDKDIHSDSRTDLVTEQCELDMLALWERRADMNEDFSEAIDVDVKYKPDGITLIEFLSNIKSAGLKEDKNPEPTFEELEIERVKQAMQTLDMENPEEVSLYKSLLNIYQQLKEIYLY